MKKVRFTAGIPAAIPMLAAALLLAACAPMTPAPTEEAAPPPPAPRQPEPTVDERPTAPSITSGETRERSPAVQSLLDQGWARYNSDDYQGALTMAERAQRIDSRSAEVYLLMASAQFSLQRLALAEQLVDRGLAFAAEGSPVNRRLRVLLNRIARAAGR